ncbi:MAG: hypothetical protein [Caudoviricetes sp.]|nr:MAG: hypothetical protein [Caudoviricetes sp.]
MSKQCKCGKGYVSQWDNKCGKCRTRREQRDHQSTLYTMPEGLTSEEAREYYNIVRNIK